MKRRVHISNPEFVRRYETDILEALKRVIDEELANRAEAEQAKAGGCTVRFDLRVLARKPLYAAVIRPHRDGRRSFVNTLTREGPKDGRQRLYGEMRLNDGDALEVRISADSAAKEERWVGVCHAGRLYGAVIAVHKGQRMPGPLYLYTKGRGPIERAIAELEEYDPDVAFVTGSKGLADVTGVRGLKRR